MTFRQVLIRAFFWFFCSQVIPCAVLIYAWMKRWRKSGIEQAQKMLFFLFLAVGLMAGSLFILLSVPQSYKLSRWILFWLMIGAMVFETGVVWRSMIFMIGFDDVRSFIRFLLEETLYALKKVVKR
jgi:hypothetical protein